MKISLFLVRNILLIRGQRGRHRERFGFRNLGCMLRITEAWGWLWLRIVRENKAFRSNQTGVLVFSPAFTRSMNARTMTGFARADTAAIAFDHRQLRRLLRTLSQRVTCFCRSIASLF
jgi:hypothetical protein